MFLGSVQTRHESYVIDGSVWGLACMNFQHCSSYDSCTAPGKEFGFLWPLAPGYHLPLEGELSSFVRLLADSRFFLCKKKESKATHKVFQNLIKKQIQGVCWLEVHLSCC